VLLDPICLVKIGDDKDLFKKFLEHRILLRCSSLLQLELCNDVWIIMNLISDLTFVLELSFIIHHSSCVAFSFSNCVHSATVASNSC
jgi:hypothetical protein